MKSNLASLPGLLTIGPALSVNKGWVFLEGRWEIKHFRVEKGPLAKPKLAERCGGTTGNRSLSCVSSPLCREVSVSAWWATICQELSAVLWVTGVCQHTGVTLGPGNPGSNPLKYTVSNPIAQSLLWMQNEELLRDAEQTMSYTQPWNPPGPSLHILHFFFSSWKRGICNPREWVNTACDFRAVCSSSFASYTDTGFSAHHRIVINDNMASTPGKTASLTMKTHIDSEGQAHKLYLFCQPRKQTVKIRIQNLLWCLLCRRMTWFNSITNHDFFQVVSHRHPSLLPLLQLCCSARVQNGHFVLSICHSVLVFSRGTLRKHRPQE